MPDSTTNPPLIPDLHLAHLRFYLSLPNYPNRNEIQKELMDRMVDESMSGLYILVIHELNQAVNSDLLSQMEKVNEERLVIFDNAIMDAEKNLGETEVRESLLAKANYLCQIGRKEEAIIAYHATADKTVALGQRLDIVFTLIRLGFFFKDQDLIRRNFKKAHALMKEGSDWDRRNRLKIYEAIQAMETRCFDKASKLFTDTLATFPSHEILDFDTFIFYTVITSIVSLDRVSLKKQVIESPEVFSAIHKTPGLHSLLHDYYNGEYNRFLESLLLIFDKLNVEPIMAPHSRWFFREMRIRAYSQFLESYRSVQLNSMASQFGISPETLDEELAKFIAANRINAKIDRVAGIIETNRPYNNNSLYEVILKQGDLFLNRVQKLAARVINL